MTFPTESLRRWRAGLGAVVALVLLTAVVPAGPAGEPGGGLRRLALPAGLLFSGAVLFRIRRRRRRRRAAAA